MKKDGIAIFEESDRIHIKSESEVEAPEETAGVASRTLLTFVGYHDPYYRGPLEDEDLKGPILYLLELERFDRVLLFATPNLTDRTNDTAGVIRETHEGTEVEILHCDGIEDPTDYGQIFSELRRQFRRIDVDRAPDSNAYYIATASGTPQMHAVWLMMAAAGEIPAKILQARPPRFVTAQKHAVDEVDPLAAGFPRVRVPDVASAGQGGELGRPDVRQAVADLGIVGRHPGFQEALERAAMFAEYDRPVLIEGETGTGKELMANLIHRLSARRASTFLPVNCSNMPATLAESLLFGHVRGAFTGADRDQAGKFVLADGGTLFLDEIGELPLEVQSKLLRVLEDGVVEPVGAARGRRVNVRIIAATNRDLLEEIEAGRFRSDLYYRVEVGMIGLLPLRRRRSDIPLLALAALDNINKTTRKARRLTQEAGQALCGYDWPGNIRQLFNLLERSVMSTRKEVLDARDLVFAQDRAAGGDYLDHLPEPGDGFNLEELLKTIREHMLRRALDLEAGNQSAAARRLGLTPQAVHNYMKRR